MEKSKIAGILTTFNKYDVNSFTKFLASPWFNSDSLVDVLFKNCLQGIHHKEHFTRQKIYKLSTGKAKYDDKHMRYLLSSLATCLENYIACKTLFEDESLLLHLRMKGLASRNSEKSYDYNYGLFNKRLENKPGGDALHYLQRFLTLYQHMNYSYHKNKRKKIIRFDEVMLELDRFYVAKKLQLLAELVNAQNVLAADYKIHLADEIKKLATKNNFSEVPVIAIYYNVLMTLTNPESEENFNALRSLLPKHSNLMPVDELNDLYQYVRNYCIKKINLGIPEWQSVLFEIYKEILGNKKLMNLDYLSQWEFKNITTLGLRLGHKKWVENFIKSYQSFLRPEERRNAFVYNMGNWYYHNGNYSETLKLFQKVEFTDVFYQLDTRSIQMKIFFEQGDEETLFFHASAFKTFLSRNKLVSTYHKNIYKNLVNFTLRLVRAGTDKTKLKKLDVLLKGNPQVADAQWIRHKLDELIQ